MRSRARRGVALSALALAACGPPSARVPAAVVSDSAGVRIVRYSLPGRALSAYRRVAGADLQIGVRDGAPEYVFSSVADLAFGPGGSIVVSEGAAAELRVFDAEGRYARTVGRRGEGPGEFASAPRILATGDELVAFDVALSRVSTFSWDGSLRSTLTLGRDGAGRPRAVTRARDATLVSTSRWSAPGGPEAAAHDPRLELDSVVVERLDEEGRVLDTVAVLPDRNRLRAVADGGGGALRVMETVTPYAAQAFVRALGERTVVGRSDALALELSTPGGPVTALRVEGVAHRATAEEIRAHQEAVVRAAAGEGDVDPLVWRINLDYLPDRLPAFADLVTGSAEIWVCLTELDADAARTWLAFDGEWTLLGAVRVPDHTRVMAVTPEALLAVWRDELGVSYVRRHPLVVDGAAANPRER